MSNSRTPRIIGRIVRLSMLLLVFSVCIILAVRVCSSGDPKSMKPLLANDALYKAYEAQGEDLLLQYQKQPSITRGEKNSGYFSVTQYVFIPEAHQVQLVFRYNNSTLEHLAKDYGLDRVPDKSEELFKVTLVLTTDLTPEDSSDNTKAETISKTRYEPTAFIKDTDSKKLYTYYRYVFDGIDVKDTTIGVFADVYYVQDIDYEEEAYGRLCLYDTEHKWFEQKLSSADIAALEEWKQKRSSGQ